MILSKSKIFLILTFILFLLSVFLISALTFSEDRTEYYFDGSIFATDNIESAGNEKGLDGILVSNGQDTRVHGWLARPDSEVLQSCVYSNTVATAKGNFAIDCNTPGQAARYVPATNNASFIGQMGVSIHPIGDEITGVNPQAIASPVPSKSMTIAAFLSRGFGTNWGCQDLGVFAACDNPIAIKFNQYQNVTYNYTGTDVVVFVDNVKMHTWEGYTGLGQVELLA